MTTKRWCIRGMTTTPRRVQSVRIWRSGASSGGVELVAAKAFFDKRPQFRLHIAVDPDPFHSFRRPLGDEDPRHGDDTTLGEERPRLAEWRERGW